MHEVDYFSMQMSMQEIRYIGITLAKTEETHIYHILIEARWNELTVSVWKVSICIIVRAVEVKV